MQIYLNLDTHISKEFALKCIFVCHESLSLHSTEHFNHIKDNRSNYEITNEDILFPT